MQKSSIRYRDWPSATILLAALLTSVGRLAVTEWTPYLYIIQLFSLFGAVLGFTLGLSSFNRRQVTILAAAYSIVLFPLQLSTVIMDESSFAGRLQSLAGRLVFSIGELVQNRPVEDVLFFVTLLSIVYWVVSVAAGYWLTRHANYLVAILPAGLIMLIIQIYDWYYTSRIWLLALYLFLALLLLGRLYYLNNQVTWREQRVFVTPGSSLDINYGVLVASALIIFIAWTFPTSLSHNPQLTDLWNRATKPWRTIREHLSDAFAAVEGTAGVGTDFYGSLLRLGTRNPEGEDVIFSVRPLSTENRLPRYYWRGRVYDQYNNGEWSSTAAVTEEFSPDQENFIIPDMQMRTAVDFSFTTGIKHSMLYSAAQPVWVSRSSQVFLNPAFDGQIDVVVIRPDTTLEVGEIYQARAAIINPTVVGLRAAGEDYPEWVKKRYLQLPDDFSPRIRQLAELLAGGQVTPYDKADVITNYLRNQIKYSSSISTPPFGRDPLEWVLFDLKQGFCTYYATAEVLMLRSVGVPARLAVGFAQGNPSVDKDGYTVVRSDAHAWPEIYFPKYGWIEFEPTGNQAPLFRPRGSDDSTLLEDDLRPPRGEIDPDDKDRILPDNSDLTLPDGKKQNAIDPLRILFITLGVILIFCLWLLKRRRPLMQLVPIFLITSFKRFNVPEPRWLEYWLRWSEQSPIERKYNIVNLSLIWLGIPPPPYATPAERATRLSKLIPDAAPAIETLVTEYQISLYSPNPGNINKASRANLQIFGHTIRALFLRSWKWFTDRFTF